MKHPQKGCRCQAHERLRARKNREHQARRAGPGGEAVRAKERVRVRVRERGLTEAQRASAKASDERYRAGLRENYGAINRGRLVRCLLKLEREIS